MQYTNIYSSTLNWYDKNKRDLPWRLSNDIYSVWLSEVMLQQTQVKTVIPYYKNWLNNFKSVEDVAYADIDDLFNVTGYKPKMSVEQGVNNFVDWYREFYG